MPIDGIIDGLRRAVLRHCEDKELADYVSDAIDALEGVDHELDKAYKEGKYVQLREDFDAVIENIWPAEGMGV